MPKTYSYKLVVVGDGAVGKSSLIRQYADKLFDDSYLPTIGADFTMKRMSLGESEVVLVIWDMGGQERFKRIRERYYLDSHAAFITFDLTRLNTFEHLEAWFEDIKKFCGDVPILMLANKNDLPEKAVSEEEVKEFATKKNVKVIFTSAKTGDNVAKIFETIAKDCLEFFDKSH